MKVLSRWITVLLIGFLCGLGGCGSGSEGSRDATTVSGKVFKGPVSGGTVTVYALSADGSRGFILGTGSAITGSDGSYSVNIGGYTGAILVEVRGGTYKDEATGNVLFNTTTLRAAVSNASGNVTVSVTPLTEIAVQVAGILNPANRDRDAANKLVSDMIGGINILTTVPVDVTSTSSKTAEAKAKDYGLSLAALSQMIENVSPATSTATSTNPALASTLVDMASDLVDDKKLTRARREFFINALSAFLDSSMNQSGIRLDTTELDAALTNASVP